MNGVTTIHFTLSDERKAELAERERVMREMGEAQEVTRSLVHLEQRLRQKVVNRRKKLRQYELESYAALGRKLSAALQDISIFEANARPGHPVVVEVSALEWAAEPLFSWVEK